MSDTMPYGASPPEAQEPDKVEEVQAEVEQPQGETEKPKPDYEKSYQELHKKFGEHSNVVGELRKQNQMLQEQMAQLAEQSKVREDKAREAPPPTDYEKMLREVAQKVEAGDMSYEDGLVQSNKITREWTKAENEMEKASLLEAARSEVTNILQAKDSEQVVSKFHERNPDFQQLVETGALDQLKAEDPLLDNLSAYWKHQAMTAKEKEAAAFEAGKQDALRVKAGSEKAGKVLADPGSSMQNQRKPSGPRSDADLKAGMLAAIS
jgi:hypothetical protein